MIFVTLGTQDKQFNRLASYISLLSYDGYPAPLLPERSVPGYCIILHHTV